MGGGGFFNRLPSSEKQKHNHRGEGLWYAELDVSKLGKHLGVSRFSQCVFEGVTVSSECIPIYAGMRWEFKKDLKVSYFFFLHSKGELLVLALHVVLHYMMMFFLYDVVCWQSCPAIV